MVQVLTTSAQTAAVQIVRQPIIQETDEEIIERMRTRFLILDEMTKAVKAGDVTAMIVVGAPGSGKSFGVQKVLEKHDFIATMSDAPPTYEIVKGHMTALGLFRKLWTYRDTNNILVLDDCDFVYSCETSLNILKGALDSSEHRRISWNSDSRILKEEGIPNTFEYNGGCIFITNLKFENSKSKKLKDHLEALESRCHYLDLTIDTDREKMLRIKQLVADGMLDRFGFNNDELNEMIDFIDENKKRMRELSLRSVIKMAELHKSMPRSWKQVASVTLMRH